jgi:glutamate N-acetyltransferase/amino-acid N-acetyltransferase
MKDNSCPGFRFGGMASGIKVNGNPDLGIIISEKEADVAAVFTRNLVCAAPVLLCKERVKNGRANAVIANSGNANCCTGEKGMENAIKMTKAVSSVLGISDETVFCASTGVIGEPLPVEKIEAASEALVKSASSEGMDDFAKAIMTTDLVPKIHTARRNVSGKTLTVTGAAKGSGMIQPGMATMLCFICTDMGIKSDSLYDVLYRGTEKSFNRITVDGDMSTNDTVLVMANGMSGLTSDDPEAMNAFDEMLTETLLALAKMVVKDGEGATKLVKIEVNGAETDNDALLAAREIANSNLVKTALFGEDANWGRIIAAAGRSGAKLDQTKIDIYFNDVQMVRNGMGLGKQVEAEVSKILKFPEYTIRLELNAGNGSDFMYTCDFSYDYVKINISYRS